MLVDCPECAHSYRVGAADLGAHGRTLICSRCDARWFEPGTLPQEPAPLAPSAVATAAFVTTIFARPMPRRGCALVALALLAATAIGARVPIVRAVPRIASLYAAAGWPVNVRGLAIARLRSASRDRDDAAAQGEAGGTVVAGDIRNLAHRRVRLPRLAFEVRDGAGAVLASWSEALPAATLAADAHLAFASTPRRLPPDGRTVLARFADDGFDAMPGAP